MRSVLTLVVLLVLAGAAYYYWRYRNRELKGTNIGVEAYRRQVTLTGEVDAPAQRQLAADIARGTADVAGATDQIRMRGQAVPDAPAASPSVPAARPTARPGARNNIGTGPNDSLLDTL